MTATHHSHHACPVSGSPGGKSETQLILKRLLPKAESENSLVVMMLAAAACSLWATVLMARLCTLAADSLSAEPGLPTATLRS